MVLQSAAAEYLVMKYVTSDPTSPLVGEGDASATVGAPIVKYDLVQFAAAVAFEVAKARDLKWERRPVEVSWATILRSSNPQKREWLEWGLAYAIAQTESREYPVRAAKQSSQEARAESRNLVCNLEKFADAVSFEITKRVRGSCTRARPSPSWPEIMARVDVVRRSRFEEEMQRAVQKARERLTARTTNEWLVRP